MSSTSPDRSSTSFNLRISAPPRLRVNQSEVSGQSHHRTRTGLGVTCDPLAPVKVHPNVAADSHRHARPGVDPIKAGLDSAPDPDAGRELAIDRAREGGGTIGERVAAAKADDPGLDISIERETPRHRPIIDPALCEEREGVAAAAIAAELDAALRRDPHGDRTERVDADTGRELAPAAIDRRA